MIQHIPTTYGKQYIKRVDNHAQVTLLLLHGFMEDHAVWNEIYPYLKANVWLADGLGFGESEPNEIFDFSIEQQAASLAECIQQLKPAKLAVLGHSMGGYTALELMQKTNLAALGLLQSTAIDDTPEKKQNRNKTMQVLDKDPALFIREFYWNLFAEHRKEEFAAVIEDLKSHALQVPVKYISKTVKGLRDRKNLQEEFRLFQGNKLIISGTYDKLIPAEDIKKLAGEVNAGYQELPDSGHMGFYENPKELIQILNDWTDAL